MEGGTPWERLLALRLQAPSPAFLLPFPRRQDHTRPHTCPVISHAQAHEGKPSRCCPSDVTDSLKLMSQPKILTDITHTLLSLQHLPTLLFLPKGCWPRGHAVHHV